MRRTRRKLLAFAVACVFTVNAQAQTAVTLELLPQSPDDKKFRVGAVAGFSASQLGGNEYRVYGTSHLPRAKWLPYTSEARRGYLDYFWESQTNNDVPPNVIPDSPVLQEIDNCDVDKNPTTWNRRCIDSIGLWWKNLACTASTPACVGNDRWNAHPGTANMSTYPTFPLLNADGTYTFGWPSRKNWGVDGYVPVLDKDHVNARQPAPPPTNSQQVCHPVNAASVATGTANSKAAQVRYADGTTRWFMAYNSQVHNEVAGDVLRGFNGADLWRVQWAYSNDGKTWTPETRPLFLDSQEANGWCWNGLLMTDMFVDGGYFYVVANRVLSDLVFLFRSRIDQTRPQGYEAAGWQVRGQLKADGTHEWRSVPTGQQADIGSLGVSVVPSLYNPNYGGAIKQTTIARVFRSSQQNQTAAQNPSKFVAVTLDHKGGENFHRVQLWLADDLSKPFVFQGPILNAPRGGYGFEFDFVHHPDNTQATPRLFDNDLEIWFVQSARCDDLALPANEVCCDDATLPPGQQCNYGAPDPSGRTIVAPPGWRSLSAWTVSRRRARLHGGIYAL
jgi:hypothetical protein